MINSTDRRANERTEQQAKAKAARRAEEAAIVAGLKAVLDADEQLLGFARGRISGGFFGKLTIGPEAFFAPYVNFGLTERRFVLQHIHAENGKPSEMLPHFFSISDIQSVTFSDVETFGGIPACRLALRLKNDQFFRIRFVGQGNFDSAKTIAEVFRSLTTLRRDTTTPTQRICATCKHILDQPAKFCPYCGVKQDDATAQTTAAPSAAADAPVKPDLFDEVLSFLSPEPAAAPPAEAPSAPEAPPIAEATAEGSAPTAAVPSESVTTETEAPVASIGEAGAVSAPPAVPPMPIASEAPAEPSEPLPPVAEAYAEPPAPPISAEVPPVTAAVETPELRPVIAAVEASEASMGAEAASAAIEFPETPVTPASGEAESVFTDAFSEPNYTPTHEAVMPTPLEVHPEARTEAEAEPPATSEGPALAAETSLESPVAPSVTAEAAEPIPPTVVEYVPPIAAAATAPAPVVDYLPSMPSAPKPFDLPSEPEAPSVPEAISSAESAEAVSEAPVTMTISEPASVEPITANAPHTTQATLGDLQGFVMPEAASPAPAAVEPTAFAASPATAAPEPILPTLPVVAEREAETPVAASSAPTTYPVPPSMATFETTPLPPVLPIAPAAPPAAVEVSPPAVSFETAAPTMPEAPPAAPVMPPLTTAAAMSSPAATAPVVPPSPPAPPDAAVETPIAAAQTPVVPPPAAPSVPPAPIASPPAAAPSGAGSSVDLSKPIKVYFSINRPQLQMHEVFVGENADDVIKRLKDRAAPQLPFTMRLLIMPMNPLAFVQEVVRRYNDEMKTSLPIPKTCAEFLTQCIELGFATVEAAS